MKSKFSLCFIKLFFLVSMNSAYAEYRAYELEVFDRIANSSRLVITSFSPSDFVQVNGGPQRTGVIIRASWICYGDTSLYKKVCPQPKAVNPRFQPGDRVQIVLKKDGFLVLSIFKSFPVSKSSFRLSRGAIIVSIDCFVASF